MNVVHQSAELVSNFVTCLMLCAPNKKSQIKINKYRTDRVTVQQRDIHSKTDKQADRVIVQKTERETKTDRQTE